MRRTSRVAVYSVPLAVGVVLAGSGVAVAQPSAADVANARTGAGISALQGIKKTLSPAEQKQSSQLVVEKRLRADRGLAAALPNYRTGLPVT